jgi:hypothetical protein
MRTLIFCAMFLGLRSPQIALGAETKGSPTETRSKKPASDAETLVGSGAVRAQKPIGLSFNVTPVSDYMLMYGGNASFSFGPDFESSLMVLAGSQDFKKIFPEDAQFAVTKANGSAFQIMANGRYFFGNSFSVLAGLGYRNGTVSFDVSAKQSQVSVASKATAQSVILFSAIGNHWAFDNGFTLGCDWIAASLPLSQSGSHTLTTTGLTASEQTTLKNIMSDLATDLGGITSLTLALVNVGYRF